MEETGVGSVDEDMKLSHAIWSHADCARLPEMSVKRGIRTFFASVFPL